MRLSHCGRSPLPSVPRAQFTMASAALRLQIPIVHWASASLHRPPGALGSALHTAPACFRFPADRVYPMNTRCCSIFVCSTAFLKTISFLMRGGPNRTPCFFRLPRNHGALSAFRRYMIIPLSFPGCIPPGCPDRYRRGNRRRAPGPRPCPFQCCLPGLRCPRAWRD